MRTHVKPQGQTVTQPRFGAKCRNISNEDTKSTTQPLGLHVSWAMTGHRNIQLDSIPQRFDLNHATMPYLCSVNSPPSHSNQSFQPQINFHSNLEQINFHFQPRRLPPTSCLVKISQPHCSIQLRLLLNRTSDLVAHLAAAPLCRCNIGHHPNPRSNEMR